ncbi:L,D-transpeptidase family protein [Bosea sp. (in: a-proteobacteria)]|uniref:L,D-transpeptidase family protein n=1 Tax=Bosea sp. (in: a-proteobacteria) TaxID=1871050 RepID=UPI00260CDACA|nr:L,D-transpeptidase family protein [Bosea sp. (in: a-proteobacteria)]MCO5092351.1 L,D-transpeptidase family protein [Bosea sp. (in: a-proteobacteria)]
MSVRSSILAAAAALLLASTALVRANEPSYGPNTYDRTLEALIAHEDIANRGGWPKVPAGATALKPDSQGPDVTALKQRLVAGGDLAPEAVDGDVYDAAVTEAVKRFQRRHGLSDLGTVGRLTLKAMNTPVEARLNQLTATLERLKGNGFNFASRYVVVNIPGASVEAVENGTVRERHLAIVGRPDRPSPVIQANITSVNLNPYWTVPMSIVKADIIPHMRKDPGFIAKSNMKLLGAENKEIDPASVNWSGLTNPYFYVRQEPGPTNSLGQLKIDMPNSDAVYMHDTPKKSLFRNDVRFNSSGCARIEGVRDLAAWLLEGSEWTRSAIEDEIAKGERKNIALKKPVPVAWVYLTGWQGADGQVQFRDDIYGLDTPQGIVTSTIQPRKPKPKAAALPPARPAAAPVTASN